MELLQFRWISRFKTEVYLEILEQETLRSRLGFGESIYPQHAEEIAALKLNYHHMQPRCISMRHPDKARLVIGPGGKNVTSCGRRRTARLIFLTTM